MKVILASKSPRRQELLKTIYDEFEVMESGVDENYPEDMEFEDIPAYLAVRKAMAVAKGREDSLVIASDTCVFLDGKSIGKPENEEEARKFLGLLSGRTHTVITGCCAAYKGRQVSFSDKALVRFYRLSDQEIDDYVASGEAYDKAGGYGIQGKGKLLVHSIEGDYYNVVGLPVARLKRVLDAFLSI